MLKKRLVKIGNHYKIFNLKQEDPMGYLMRKYGEGAGLSSQTMALEGLVDVYDPCFNPCDTNFREIGSGLAIDLTIWENEGN